MVSISHALRRIKGNLDSLLSETYLSQLASDAGCRWRKRRLTPAVTIQLFILQILHGNVCCAHAPRLGGNSSSTTGNSVSASHNSVSATGNTVPASCKPVSTPSKPVTASAYCQARMRLPLELLRTLVRRVAERLQQSAGANGRWHGHRTFLLDGSSCSMPDAAALQREFGQPPPVIINPLRPGRYEPRVRKRRPPEYSLMPRPRAELRKALLEQSFAA